MTLDLSPSPTLPAMELSHAIVNPTDFSQGPTLNPIHNNHYHHHLNHLDKSASLINDVKRPMEGLAVSRRRVSYLSLESLTLLISG